MIGSADNPGWSVADAQVENFPSSDQTVETLHDFFSRHRKVPPMKIQL